MAFVYICMETRDYIIKTGVGISIPGLTRHMFMLFQAIPGFLYLSEI
jgi:hypothetical protein